MEHGPPLFDRQGEIYSVTWDDRKRLNFNLCAGMSCCRTGKSYVHYIRTKRMCSIIELGTWVIEGSSATYYTHLDATHAQ